MSRNRRDYLYSRDSGICGICFEAVRYEDFTCDHVVPRSKQGKDDYSNLQIAHKYCNLMKADYTEDSLEFQEIRAIILEEIELARESLGSRKSKKLSYRNRPSLAPQRA